MPELALRFILSNKQVGTIIPGMRKIRHVEANVGTSDGNGLPEDLLRELKAHRWERTPTQWSQ
jgi:aryl-alcohol dehydrogenase-like predicted oxidoreductase